MVAFIDQERATYGVEPICAVLPIAPSTYFRQKALQANPEQRSPRAKREARLRLEIQRVHAANHDVYGAKKVWKQLNREAVPVARCTVARLMKELGSAVPDAVGRGPTRRSPRRCWRGRATWWSAPSWRRGRISCGWQTSRTSRRGGGLSTWHS